MIVNVQKKWFFFLFITIISSASIKAQVIKSKDNNLRAQQAIMDLKDGALVVRLKSKRNKIEKLQEAIASPNLPEKEKKRLQKDLDNTIQENEEYNSSIVSAFDQYFKFSPVYYIYDTSAVDLKAGKKSGYFLDTNLKKDPNITFTQDSFFIIYNGELSATNNSGMEALIIIDSQNQPLPSPFPYYIKTNNFWYTLGRFFSPKKAIKRDSKKVVSKLDYNINEYYKKTVAKLKN